MIMTWGIAVKTNTVKVALFVVVAVLIASLHSFTATAKTANTLKISPVRSDIEIKPGESKVVKITVTNLTDEPIAIRPVQNDFVSGDENGTPALIINKGKQLSARSLKQFMRPLSDTTIPGNATKTIEAVIAVPKNAQAGGYFGAVRFAPASPDGGGQVNLSPSIASLILLTVPGPVIEKLELTRFEIEQDGATGLFF